MITAAKNKLRRILPKNTSARGVSVLVGGTASAQILLLLAAPLLTRLYSPEDFGLLAVYSSLLALISVISSLRYELAIPLPEEDGEAANVAVLCLILVGISTVLTGLTVLLMGSAIAAALDVPPLAGFLWLLPVGVMLTGFYSVFNYWTMRGKQFTTLAKTKLFQAVGTIAIQLSAFKLGGIALLLGQVAGQGIGIKTLGLPALKNAVFKQVRWAGIKKAACRYKKFPIFLTWDGFLNTTGSQLPPLLFAYFFSPMAAGLYALAHRVLNLPMTLIGGAVGQVFFANGANAYRNKNHGPLVSQFQEKLIHIGAPPAVLLILVGPDLFSILFGEAWRQAGDFARWMAPWLFFNFVYSPLSALFAIMELQKQVVLLQLILVTFRTLAIGAGAFLGDLLVSVALFSAVSALCYLAFILRITHISRNSMTNILFQIIKAVIYSIIVLLPIILVMILSWSSSLVWLAALIISLTLLAIRYSHLLTQANK